MDFSDILEVLGLLCLIAFAFIIWWPLAIAVTGVSLLAVSFLRSRRGR